MPNPIKWEHPSNYRYGGGKQASIAYMQDPDDVEVGGGVAGEVSSPLESFLYECVVVHVTALASGATPTDEDITLEVSNDGVNWFPEVVLNFTGLGTQEIILEEIKFRYVRSSIPGGALGSYLITAFCAQ